jgi:methylenetetrahydrofolate reductase (NADPH)
MPAIFWPRRCPLKGLADAVNVTDGASARAHLSAPIAAALLVREGIERSCS